jgi:hypothetical protein
VTETSMAIPEPTTEQAWTLIYAGVEEFHLTEHHRVAAEYRDRIRHVAKPTPTNRYPSPWAYALGVLNATIDGTTADPASVDRAKAIAAGVWQALNELTNP